jgi:leucyl aminopeptidase
MTYFATTSNQNSIPIVLFTKQNRAQTKHELSKKEHNWLHSTGFMAQENDLQLIPNDEGLVCKVAVAITDIEDPFALAHLPIKLPKGNYHLTGNLNAKQKDTLSLGWALACYQFDRYKKSPTTQARLVIDDQQNLAELESLINATNLTRDLINTPASDMMPADLAEQVEALATAFNAQSKQIIGDELLVKNYPSIHAVGRASVHEPRLLELTWGDSSHPKLTLVGKGICFDSGGLDIKPSSGMRYMKKDMGGAAHAIALSQLIMSQNIPVRLRLLVCAAENAIAGNSFRPGDVLSTRKGLRVEVDNTDAEGRLVLSDALTEASREEPDLILDFATLTGAARVALGTEVPVFFCNNATIAAALTEAGTEIEEPIWQLPLHKPYRDFLNSDVADITNCATTPFGGAITAALFLNEFVENNTAWAHFDIMAWNNRTRPGRPKGGEAMGLRAVYQFLKNRYT